MTFKNSLVEVSTLKTTTFGLVFAILSQGLVGCTKANTPQPGGSPTVVAVTASPSLSSTPSRAESTVVLFDGRAFDSPSPEEPAALVLETLEREVKRAAKEPALSQLVGNPVDLQAENFKVVGSAKGSFTQVGTDQTVYLYRLGLTNGLIVLENDAVVGHFSGGPGDYAHYIHLTGTDVDKDGLTDLVLVRNVEDTEDLFAYLFSTTPAGPKFIGEAAVYSSTVVAGEINDPDKSEAKASKLLVTSGSPPQYKMETYLRRGSNEWQMEKPETTFEWENRFEGGGEPSLANLLQDLVDPARLKEAISKLKSYSDVPSSIDYANPKNEAEMLVATDPTLQLMEILNTRAAVYAYENATKEQVDHSDISRFSLSLDGLKTVDEIEDAYIKHTNESLGGQSPYLK